MQLTTDKAISALLAADDSVKATDAKTALAILRGNRASAETAQALYTRAEAAEMLRVSPRTISRWIREGVLKAAKIAGRRGSVGLVRSSVDALANGGRAA